MTAGSLSRAAATARRQGTAIRRGTGRLLGTALRPGRGRPPGTARRRGSVRRPGRGAWFMWGIGLTAYVIGVFNRSSLGVAGPDATERFGIPASTLALFSVVQLVVYAVMQVPVGVLLDRFGTRRMVVTGSLLMAGGQFIFAFTHDIRIAFAARILIGAGDAMMFISVLRLVALWFPARRVPLVQQLSGIIGQSGAIVAAVPLVALLGLAGWTSTFALAAALGVFATVIVMALVRDAPPDAPPEHTTPPPGLAAVRHQLGKAWQEPGTRLGLWTHFATQFSGTTFVLLWGYPFLVDGEGFSPATAGLLLTLLTLTGMVFGIVPTTAFAPYKGGRIGHGLRLALATLEARVPPCGSGFAIGSQPRRRGSRARWCRSGAAG